MSRHAQWDARLVALVAQAATRPHVFGDWDCLLWPAAAVKAVTGKDYARGHRGKYKSLASAYAYLTSLGFDGPASFLGSLFEEKPIGFAQRGDLVLVNADNGLIPAVCMGGFALMVGEQGDSEGLIKVPRELWLKAWRV